MKILFTRKQQQPLPIQLSTTTAVESSTHTQAYKERIKSSESFVLHCCQKWFGQSEKRGDIKNKWIKSGTRCGLETSSARNIVLHARFTMAPSHIYTQRYKMDLCALNHSRTSVSLHSADFIDYFMTGNIVNLFIRCHGAPSSYICDFASKGSPALRALAALWHVVAPYTRRRWKEYHYHTTNGRTIHIILKHFYCNFLHF